MLNNKIKLLNAELESSNKIKEENKSLNDKLIELNTELNILRKKYLKN